MGALDKLFGLVLVLAGATIALYYSAWVFMTLVRHRLLLNSTAIRNQLTAAERNHIPLQPHIPGSSLALLAAGHYSRPWPCAH